MKKISLITFILSLSLFADVSIVSTSYQEQVKIMPNGEKSKEWVHTQKVVPGTVVRYVNSLENSGTLDAEQLVIDNPIPENMVYVSDSALCQDGCSISYSIDGGVTFSQAEKLYVGEGLNRHIAKASEYTNIRWVVSRLSSSAQSYVEYKAKLK